MSKPDLSAVERVAAPSLVPADIDYAHLARMTLGDKHLEAEVLGLFERQADLLLTRMRGAPAAAAAALAHTLKGSARGIGMWKVAAAAEAVELAAGGSGAVEVAAAVEQLAAVIAAARAAVADLLAAR